MKFLSQIKAIGILLLLIPTSLAWGETLASDALIQQLEKLKSLRAHFIQTIIDEQGQVLQQTRGKMALKRPGQFLWEIEQPSKQLLIADGKQVWFYDKDLQQVTVQKQQKIETNSPAALLSNDPKDLTKRFTVLGLEQYPQGFYLAPKDKNALFRSIRLIFQQGRLHQMYLLDRLGQQTIIRFSNVELNPFLSPQTFHFILPNNKNIEVVRG